MLILPPGHGRAVASRRRLAPRERRIVAIVSGLCGALVVVVVVALVATAAKPARGCLNVSFASSLGVQTLTSCGAQARAVCDSVGTSGGYSGRAGQLIAADCRKLKLPVGPTAP